VPGRSQVARLERAYLVATLAHAIEAGKRDKSLGKGIRCARVVPEADSILPANEVTDHAACAGRPPKGRYSSEPHKKRPRHIASRPLHINMRVVRSVGSLRRRHMYKALREATIAVAKREDFRIVHFSIQSNHIHLIAEAQNK